MSLKWCYQKKYNHVFLKLMPLFGWMVVYLTICACTLDKNQQFPMTEIKTLTSSQSVTHCIQYDVATYNEIQSHKLMLVLEVSRYQPSAKNAGLQVAIIDVKSNVSINIHRPAIYPNNVFDVSDGDVPIRFNIPLSKHLKSIGHSQSCFDITFDEIDDVDGTMDLQLFFAKI